MKHYVLYLDDDGLEINYLIKSNNSSAGVFRLIKSSDAWEYDGDLSPLPAYWPENEIISFDYLTEYQKQGLIIAIFYQDWRWLK
jgi:hypothetical protein